MHYFTDSHCHLTYPREDNLSVDFLIKEARSHKVESMLCISTTHDTFPEIQRVARENKSVFASYGIHPNHVREEKRPDALIQAAMRSAAQEPTVVALGETGLDYHHNYAPKERQQELFRLHLAMGRELGLPVIIHTRDAEEDTMTILKEAFDLGTPPSSIVLHCFTGSQHLADFAIKHGVYLSASGVITFKNAPELQRIFAKVPDDLLLIETDTPYLAPIPHRGKPNRPAYVVRVAEKLAVLRHQDVTEIARITSENFLKLCPKATTNRVESDTQAN